MAEDFGSVRRTAPIRVKPKHELRKPVAKPVQRATKQMRKVNSAELKPDGSGAQRRERTPPAAAAGGHYELSPLMTRMVEAELQDIMIKVWQELPDHPPDDVEELVVDKLRNQAGDDLRNALGLNITKRLLNVHNPLYVKIQFTGKPEKAHLSAFLKKYNFNAFKRIVSTVNTFAAQVRSVADFDRICAATDIRCGNIKVTVNPCYRFTKCPANLRTCFNDNEDEKEKDMDVNEIYGVEDKLTDTQPNVNDTKHSQESKTDKVENATKEKPQIVEEPKTEVKPINDVGPEPKAEANQAKVEANIAEKSNDVKINVKTDTAQHQNVATPVRNAKGNEGITNDSDVEAKNAKENQKEITPVKVVKGDDLIVNKNSNAKSPLKNKAQQPVTTPNPNVLITGKVAKGNDLVVNKQLNTKIASTSTNNKTAAKINTTPKPKVITPVKVAKGNAVVSAKSLQTKKVEKVEDDYDELDDHDILALMSEGIVLDECSGSDDE